MSDGNEIKPVDDCGLSPLARLIKMSETYFGDRTETQDAHQAFLGADAGPFIKEMETQNA